MFPNLAGPDQILYVSGTVTQAWTDLHRSVEVESMTIQRRIWGSSSARIRAMAHSRNQFRH